MSPVLHGLMLSRDQTMQGDTSGYCWPTYMQVVLVAVLVQLCFFQLQFQLKLLISSFFPVTVKLQLLFFSFSYSYVIFQLFSVTVTVIWYFSVTINWCLFFSYFEFQLQLQLTAITPPGCLSPSAIHNIGIFNSQSSDGLQTWLVPH